MGAGHGNLVLGSISLASHWLLFVTGSRRHANGQIRVPARQAVLILWHVFAATDHNLEYGAPNHSSSLRARLSSSVLVPDIVIALQVARYCEHGQETRAAAVHHLESLASKAVWLGAGRQQNARVGGPTRAKSCSFSEARCGSRRGHTAGLTCIVRLSKCYDTSGASGIRENPQNGGCRRRNTASVVCFGFLRGVPCDLAPRGPGSSRECPSTEGGGSVSRLNLRTSRPILAAWPRNRLHRSSFG
jgi:hypothetical protein